MAKMVVKYLICLRIVPKAIIIGSLIGTIKFLYFKKCLMCLRHVVMLTPPYPLTAALTFNVEFAS